MKVNALFKALCQEYDDANRRLALKEPLALKVGLGPLAGPEVGSIWREVFQVLDFQYFLPSLIGYKTKMDSYAQRDIEAEKRFAEAAAKEIPDRSGVLRGFGIRV